MGDLCAISQKWACFPSGCSSTPTSNTSTFATLDGHFTLAWCSQPLAWCMMVYSTGVLENNIGPNPSAACRVMGGYFYARDPLHGPNTGPPLHSGRVHIPTTHGADEQIEVGCEGSRDCQYWADHLAFGTYVCGVSIA